MIQEQVTPSVKQDAIAYAMKNYTAYNLWANTTMVTWLRTKPAAVLETEAASSFSSVKLTLVHIWQVQQYWLSVVAHTEYAPQPFHGSVEEICTLLLAQSEQWLSYVTAMTEEDICDPTRVVNQWFESYLNNFEYIIQCMNHSTYHRGQIVTIGRQLGLTDAPMTDYNYYNVRGK